MSWLERLFGTKETSSSVAKRRLQMVLVHDRSDLPAGLLEEIKDEIIAIIARRLAIDSGNVIVHLEQTAQENRLIAEVPLAPVNGRRGTAAATR
jgi:cell division topological specificity factor